jgi:hypothetical protein
LLYYLYFLSLVYTSTSRLLDSCMLYAVSEVRDQEGYHLLSYYLIISLFQRTIILQENCETLPNLMIPRLIMNPGRLIWKRKENIIEMYHAL